MTKTKIKVEIVADSINQQGDRLTSLVLTYPRIIHAEMMTHRMFSRNASSSRAVPVDKMIKAVRENTFCPFEFQKSHKGMQGSEYFTGKDKQECVDLWLESAELALQQAEKMKAKGISKQIINRILEPYQYYKVLITGSKEGWQNFFKLRCPSYLYDYEDNPIYFKSKKDWVNYYNESQGYKENNPDFTKVENLTTLEWLQLNKGQAEIHMMMLSEAIYDAMNESTPKQLKAGEWHIPFEDKIDEQWLTNYLALNAPNLKLEKGILNSISIYKVKVSTAMAAHTSYTTVGNEPVKSYEKWIELHDRLIAYDPPHSSPMEHCARAMSNEEYNDFIKGQNELYKIDPDNYVISYNHKNSDIFGWCYNLKGFISYRYLIDNKINL